MARVNWRASNLLNPLPVVLITSMDHEGKSNVMTAAWAGTICSDPVMVSVSIRKSRYSHELISQSGEFVINMPGVDMALFTDYAGVYSGRNTDKFALAFAKCRVLGFGLRDLNSSALELFCPVHFVHRFRLLGFVWDEILYIKSASDQIYLQ